MSFELVLFLALAGLAVLFAVGMLLSENAVHSALFLIGNFGCVAVLYLMLEAPFIGMVQIAVYAGAIMVLFLFVIMLLGAEQTTDTTRRFRWLTGAATGLAASFFVAIVAPLVLGGVALPQPQQPGAHVRFIHAAGIPDNRPVNVTVSGGALAEPLVLPGLDFGDVSGFTHLGAGTYSVLVQGADGSPIMPPAQFTVEDNLHDALSVALIGQFNLDAGTFPTLAPLPQDLSPTVYDTTRVLLFNGHGAAPLALVDLGPNDLLDVTQRPDLGPDGAPVLDAAGLPISVYVIDDTVIVPFTDPLALSDPAVARGGEGRYALIQQDFEIVYRLLDRTLLEASEHLVLVTPDYLQFTPTPGVFRPFVLPLETTSLRLPAPFGSPASIGEVLFTDYLLPVNVVGILLLVALVGVVVLTRPDTEKSDRRVVRRRKVNRPLTSVISTQTGGEVSDDAPRLPRPQSGD